MQRPTTARMLMTFDVTDWPESTRRRLESAGADIAASLIDNDASTDWTEKALTQLIGMLAAQGAYTQAHTINEAIANGGEISRERVYELGGYDAERSLKGFTRPIRRLVNEMKEQGLVPDEVLVPLAPIYDAEVKGYQRTRGFRLVPGITQLFDDHESGA